MDWPHTILGACLFRGTCLALAFWRINIWWFEPLGGLHLIWLSWKHFARYEPDEQEGAVTVAHEGNWLYRHPIGRLGPSWATGVVLASGPLLSFLDPINLVLHNELSPG